MGHAFRFIWGPEDMASVTNSRLVFTNGGLVLVQKTVFLLIRFKINALSRYTYFANFEILQFIQTS